MFARAYELASQYTRPFITSARHYDGRVECSVAAFVVLNDEGWIITAAHMLELATAHAAHQSEIAEYERHAAAIDAGEGTAKGKTKRVRALAARPDWVRNYSLWTGWDGRIVSEFHVLPGVDLALGRLEPFEPSLVGAYPLFAERSDALPGTCVCKLGYPFHSVSTTFDEAADAFVFAEGTFPLPQFPLEGIVTRTRVSDRGRESGIEVVFLETSSPGLRGQSGGPIFDTRGRVLGIQVHTVHYPLGFSPAVERDGQRLEEHQFLNTGVGVHVQTVLSFLRRHGVRVAVA